MCLHGLASCQYRGMYVCIEIIGSLTPYAIPLTFSSVNSSLKDCVILFVTVAVSTEVCMHYRDNAIPPIFSIVNSSVKGYAIFERLFTVSISIFYT